MFKRRSKSHRARHAEQDEGLLSDEGARGHASSADPSAEETGSDDEQEKGSDEEPPREDHTFPAELIAARQETDAYITQAKKAADRN